MTKPLADLLTQIEGGGPIDRGAIHEHLARYDQLLGALGTMTDAGKEVARGLKRLADNAQYEREYGEDGEKEAQPERLCERFRDHAVHRRDARHADAWVDRG